MGEFAALFVMVGIVSSAFAPPSVVVLLILVNALAIAIDAIWFGHFPIWFAIIAGVALQVGYVLGVLGQAVITRFRRRR